MFFNLCSSGHKIDVRNGKLVHTEPFWLTLFCVLCEKDQDKKGITNNAPKNFIWLPSISQRRKCFRNSTFEINHVRNSKHSSAESATRELQQSLLRPKINLNLLWTIPYLILGVLCNNDRMINEVVMKSTLQESSPWVLTMPCDVLQPETGNKSINRLGEGDKRKHGRGLLSLTMTRRFCFARLSICFDKVSLSCFTEKYSGGD